MVHGNLSGELTVIRVMAMRAEPGQVTEETEQTGGDSDT